VFVALVVETTEDVTVTINVAVFVRNGGTVKGRDVEGVEGLDGVEVQFTDGVAVAMEENVC
jgi:hypothetical protein